MKKINELVDVANLPTQTQCSSSRIGLSKQAEAVVTRLFAVLAAQYGHKWTSLITDEATLHSMELAWGSALEGINPMAIKQALDRLPSMNPNWPPTVGQFKEICNVGQDPVLLPQLPKPRCDEKVALDAIEQMKKDLGI